MIEKLAQGTALVCSSSLRAVHRVEGLVEEETNSPAQVHPRRTVRVKSWVVPQQGEDVDDHEAEASQSDLS